MNGNCYTYVKNSTRNTYAWVEDEAGGNTITVTDSADISGWQVGDTITTATGGNADMLKIDIQPLIDAKEIDGNYDVLWGYVKAAPDSIASPLYTGLFASNGYGGPWVAPDCPVANHFSSALGIAGGTTKRYVYLRGAVAGGISILSGSGAAILGYWK